MKSFDGKNGDISSGRGVWVNQKSRAHLHKMKGAWISRNCQLIDKLKLQIDGAYFSGYFSTSFHFTISNNDFSRCHCVILIMLNVSEGNKTSDKVYLWWNDQINIFFFYENASSSSSHSFQLWKLNWQAEWKWEREWYKGNKTVSMGCARYLHSWKVVVRAGRKFGRSYETKGCRNEVTRKERKTE